MDTMSQPLVRAFRQLNITNITLASSFSPETNIVKERIPADSLSGNLLTFNAGGARRQPCHVTRYEYPSTDVPLPSGSAFYLPPPLHFQYRIDPEKSSCTVSEADTTYSTVTAVQTLHCVSQPPDSPSLVQVMERLSTIEGFTDLKMLTFTSNTVNRIFRIRRDTVYKSASDDPARPALETSYHDFDAEGWRYLTRGSGLGAAATKDCDCVWACLLHDLYLRQSDHAYWAVKRALLRYGGEAAVRRYSGADIAWGSATPHAARELFELRLVLEIRNQRNRSMRQVSFGEFDPLTEDLACLGVSLPCGHSFSGPEIARFFHPDHYEGRDDDYYLRLGCCVCASETVFTPQDLEHLALSRIFAERKQYDALVDSVSYNSPRMIFYWSERELFLSGPVVLQVINAGLALLKPPETVMPSALQFENCEETRFALEKMSSLLTEAGSERCRFRVRDLYDSLRIEVLRALRGSATDLSADEAEVPVPPGWYEFFDSWLARSMNVLLEGRCDIDREAHHGIHRHRRGTVIKYHATEVGNGQGLQELEATRLHVDITATVLDEVDEGPDPYDDLEEIGRRIEREAVEEQILEENAVEMMDEFGRMRVDEGIDVEV